MVCGPLTPGPKVTEEFALFSASRLARSDALDDLLSRYHSATMNRPQRVSSRIPSKSAGVGQYLISRQYDDDNGALYDDEEAAIVDQVEWAILQVAEPGRSALFAQARALCLGTGAMTSPRLPTDVEQRATILSNAREELMRRLNAAGVL